MRPPSALRRALIAAAPLLIYVGLTLLLFRPLLPDLGTALHDRSDTTLNTWIIAWQAHVLPRDPLALFDAPIFHPLPDTLALSEILWPFAPLAVPLLAATGNPVLTYNLLFLAAFPLAGLGAYLLALYVTRYTLKVGRSGYNVQRKTFNVQRVSAFLAGLIYAFSPHQFGHLSQLQLLSIAWLPLTLLFLERLWRDGRAKDGVLFALCAVFQTLSAFYYGFQIALAVGVYVVVRFGGWGWSVVSDQLSVVSRRLAVGRLAALFPWIALAALLVAPFALPYLRVRSDLGLERTVGETAQNAATLSEWVRPPSANPLYRALPGLASAEGGLFPGVIVLGLAALGLGAGGWGSGASRQSSVISHQSSVDGGRPPSVVGGPSSVVHRPSSIPRAYWLILGLAAVILSLGPRLKLTAGDPGGLALPFGWLYAHVPGMTAIRAPGRFANTAFLALAMLAALGAMWLLERLVIGTPGWSGAIARPTSTKRTTEAQRTPRLLMVLRDLCVSVVTFGARRTQILIPAISILLAVLIVAEYTGGLGRFAVQPMPPADTPLYAWLAAQPPSAIVELPLTSEMAAAPGRLPLAERVEASGAPRAVGASTSSAPAEAGGAAAFTGVEPVETTVVPWPDYNLLRYQYFQTEHWQPTIDGYSGFVPPHHRELGLTLAHFPDARSLTLLRGLGVEWVIVHSAVMDAFQPGRAAALREALAGTPGAALDRTFGGDWVYRLGPAPQPSGPLIGRFWSTPGGQAFLILRAASPDGWDVVIPPGSPLRVRGSWQPAGDGAAQPFAAAAMLPLMVDAGSVAPLDLPRPAADGAYTLRLEASDARVAAAPYAREVAVEAGAHPAKLLAVQAIAPGVGSTAASAVPARGSIPVLPSDARSIGLNQGDADALRFAPGQPITITLPWRLLDRPDGDASVSARILDANGRVVAQDDRALSGGIDLVQAWQPGMIVTTTHALSLPEAPGRYTLQAFLYRLDDPTGLFFLDEAGEPAASLGWPLKVKPAQMTVTPLPPPDFLARFGAAPGGPSGDEIYLLSAQPQLPPHGGAPLRVDLTWAAARPPAVDYTVFAHLASPAGELLAQRDAPPQDGRYPTTAWDAGEVVTDTLDIPLPEALAGRTLCLRLGLYDPATGVRLPRLDVAGDDWRAATCWKVDSGR